MSGPGGDLPGGVPAEVIFDRLRTVVEPCSVLMREPVDIVAMGIVEQVEVGPGGRIGVELVLTDASCIHFTRMQRYIADALSGLDGVTSVAVTASTTVLWTPDRQGRGAPAA